MTECVSDVTGTGPSLTWSGPGTRRGAGSPTRTDAAVPCALTTHRYRLQGASKGPLKGHEKLSSCPHLFVGLFWGCVKIIMVEAGDETGKGYVFFIIIVDHKCAFVEDMEGITIRVLQPTG